jgi:superfamily II helicase
VPAALVYCPTTSEVDQVAAALNAKGLPCARYHAKLGAGERAAAHAAFQRDDVAVLAATIAYGMVNGAAGDEGCVYMCVCVCVSVRAPLYVRV